MFRSLNYCILSLLIIALTGCTGIDNNDVEKILKEAKVYPMDVERKLFCNSENDVREVAATNLVREGFITTQLKHTREDIGKPLIHFTPKADPYLLHTNDTLKSLDVQRIKVAEEVFLYVIKIEINPAGDKAVVDYVTEIINSSPFIVLYRQSIIGQQKRRTFLTRKENRWSWDGKIIKMQY